MTRLVVNSHFSILTSGELTEGAADAIDQLLSLISEDRDKAWKLNLSGVSTMDAAGAGAVAKFLQSVPNARLSQANACVREFFGGPSTVPPKR